jgi:exoribonuclease-2
MELGAVVEYIDSQRILCAAVLGIKNKRLHVLTENNRELNLSVKRLSHTSPKSLDPSIGRDKIVGELKQIAQKRNELIQEIDIKELWDVLKSEQEWIDLDTMTQFCFPNNPTHNHKSAVVRAFFKNRLYFKFDHNRFFPHSEKKVEQIAAREKEKARKNKIIKEGGEWLKQVLKTKRAVTAESQQEYIKILKSTYLFEKESNDFALGKAMLKQAGITDIDKIFSILVILGVFQENENIDLHRFDIHSDFMDGIIRQADDLINQYPPHDLGRHRRDLTGLHLFTIDGQATMDFDDAISIEECGNLYRLGVHIIDIGYFVKKNDAIDQEARQRGSSIYMPDMKIPMLPPVLAENLCSLKAGEIRPAISIMIEISKTAEIKSHEIIPSWINVSRQLTYYNVNSALDEENDFRNLKEIAENFRKKRLGNGAVYITLPDISVWVDGKGDISVNRINRESPGRMMVSEIMIMANWLMAGFLAENDMPAIFRSQPEPKERLFSNSEGTLFQNWMQRRLLNRFMLRPSRDRHSGLGLEEYVTATSPIRKYFDLVTQRQIRSVMGLEPAYTAEEIENLLQLLQQPMANVSKIQYRRNRYWILKYLEKRIGEKEEAIVLAKRRNGYQILLCQYLIECDLPVSNSITLKPEDLIQITIQNVNARLDKLSVFMG